MKTVQKIINNLMNENTRLRDQLIKKNMGDI